MWWSGQVFGFFLDCGSSLCCSKQASRLQLISKLGRAKVGVFVVRLGSPYVSHKTVAVGDD